MIVRTKLHTNTSTQILKNTNSINLFFCYYFEVIKYTTIFYILYLNTDRYMTDLRELWNNNYYLRNVL